MDVKENIVKDNDENSISGEIIHYDVLNEIFKYLSLKDLHRAEAVCKLWQQVAKTEILSRNNIHNLVLFASEIPEDNNDDNVVLDYSFKYLQNKWHISDSLMSLPRVLLVFTNSASTDEVYIKYRRVLKYSMSVVVCDSTAVFMNEHIICRNNCFGVGITIPNTPRLKIDAYSLDDYDMISHGNANTLSHLADVVFNSLLTSEEEHNCFIIFSERCEDPKDALYTSTFVSELLKSLKKRFKPGTYSLWGGTFSNIVTDLDGHERHCLTWSIGLRLSGPAIKSWSIVLKLKLTNAETENKLLNFKKQIVTNSKSIAFAMAPFHDTECFLQRLSKTELFRKIFPKVPLLRIYEPETEGFIQFGTDSTNNDSEPVLKHSNSVNFLIITTK